jgi:asparagine synthase (glutamine-hydrolysing)
MCGIAGIFCISNAVHVDEKHLTKMRDTMVHRGPDGASNYITADCSVGLAHRRLSIVDLSEVAAQPMPNEDDSIWITFNGEIYNHLALRGELIKLGHFFRTNHSDTEVLVHGYEEWGLEGLVSRLEGDWAFAIWDSKERKLHLSRDRMGVKPLYFTIQGGAFFFGSEIKAIIAHPLVERDIDPIAMYHYLTFVATPAPLTMFKGIYKISAGACMTVGEGGIMRYWHYWDPTPSEGMLDIKGLKEVGRDTYYSSEIRNRLDKSVKKRMMSDVPMGVFLSGGIDSSANVALMARHSSNQVKTFTVGFKDHLDLNEFKYAEQVAKHFHTEHHAIQINELNMLDSLENIFFIRMNQ